MTGLLGSTGPVKGIHGNSIHELLNSHIALDNLFFSSNAQNADRCNPCRDIYHTKRMQRIFSVAFTTDTRYILSGSDDGNVRLWRAEASQRSHVRSARERTKLEYDNALKERYKHMPEIRRIAKHRHVPKPIKKAGEIKKVEEASLKRKEENRRRHSKKGQTRRVPQREAMVIARE